MSSEPPTKVQKTDNHNGGDKKEYFPSIPKIEYAGPDSTNPLSFRYYNPEEIILGKPMKEWLRFSVCFWHTVST
jgi:xylose isomerase